MFDVKTICMHNGSVVQLKNIPDLNVYEFKDLIVKGTEEGMHISSLFGVPSDDDKIKIYAVLSDSRQGKLHVFSCTVKDSYPSITAECIQAHLFEREIAEQWGIYPESHPMLRPVRFHGPYRKVKNMTDTDPNRKYFHPVMDFFSMAGEEVHEVAVGPVHAGIIEPGHFRFECHGESVYNLEISLGYQHRGIERQLVGGPNKRTIHYMETLSGDATIGHAVAYAELVEALARCAVPAKGCTLRGIMLELERLANHAGDLGALANDVGFLPTASYCGRIRGDFLNLTALICGSRFGRGMVRPGGVDFDMDGTLVSEFMARLEKIFVDTEGAVNLLWNTPSVIDRFENTGIISRETGCGLGLVGVAARACGIGKDVRFDFPSGIYRMVQIPVSTNSAGDVFARAFVRWLEMQKSVEFLEEQAGALPQGIIKSTVGEMLPDSFTSVLCESWRGEICHTALTDGAGRFKHYKIVDPSFHNWTGLSMALRDEEVSNFPLCNKSFNLSYCGHDL